MTQHIKTRTRSAKASRSMIDLIFSNIDTCSLSGVVDLHISDHQPVFFVKKKSKDTRNKICFSGRSYKNYSKELPSDSLTNNIKNNFRSVADPNACWDLMETFLIDFLDTHCPIKTFRSKENTPPWVTHDILILSKDRDRAWAQAKLSDSDEDWATARQFRNWANNAIKQAKSNYLQNELEANKKDPKKFWRNIRDILPEQSSGIINIKNHLNNETLPKDQQAQVVNNFFVNIGGNINAKFGPDVQLPAYREPEGLKLKINHLG